MSNHHDILTNRISEEVDSINVNLTQFDHAISDLEDYREAAGKKMKKVSQMIKKQTAVIAAMQKENNSVKEQNRQLMMQKNTDALTAELNAMKLKLAEVTEENRELNKQKHFANQQIVQLKNLLQTAESKKRKMTLALLQDDDFDYEGSSKCCICHDNDIVALYSSNPLLELCCSSGACKKIIMCKNCYAITTAEERKCVICSTTGTRMITADQLRLNNDVIDLVGTSYADPSYAGYRETPAYGPISAYSPTSPAYSPTSHEYPPTS